jgi:Spy/CpxP family protein refolding chaperone
MRNNHWKLAIGIALLGLGSFTAYAQTAQPDNAEPNGAPQGKWRRGGGQERELQNLTRVLSLTPDQQTGVKGLLEQQSTQMRALREKSQSGSTTNEAPGSQQTQMAQIRDETDTKISALLDENQKKTFADWIAKRKADMARRQGGNGGEAPQSPQQ